MSDRQLVCPRCPAEDDDGLAIPVPGFTEPGKLAAHLIERHHMSPSVALRDARAAFAMSDPAPRLQGAPGPAPAPPAAQETAMPRKNTPKPKYSRPQYKCGACGSTAHTARSTECPKAGTAESPAAPQREDDRVRISTSPTEKRFDLRNRGEVRQAMAAAPNGSGSSVEFLRAEIAKRERELVGLRGALEILGG